jgi:DNA-binding NarL/FixJ family response regulator
MATLGTIKLIIADDHEIFRDGLKLMLARQDEIELIGEADNGKDLVEMVEKLHPDVVMTDIKMPIMDGIEATRHLTEHFPEVGIIGLSMFNEDNLIIDMLEAGAKGYLLKNADKKEVLEAIKTVYQQDNYYCRQTSAKLAQMIAKSKFNPFTQKVRPEFSEREKEIIALICQEFTNKEIGEKLFLSSRTVEGYRMKILEKMNVKNTVGIVVYAMKHGFYVSPQ